MWKRKEGEYNKYQWQSQKSSIVECILWIFHRWLEGKEESTESNKSLSQAVANALNTERTRGNIQIQFLSPTTVFSLLLLEKDDSHFPPFMMKTIYRAKESSSLLVCMTRLCDEMKQQYEPWNDNWSSLDILRCFLMMESIWWSKSSTTTRRIKLERTVKKKRDQLSTYPLKYLFLV